MSGRASKRQERAWVKGLEDPHAAWKTAVAGTASEQGGNMLGNLVNALSDLTGRWLHYDARRSPAADRNSSP